MTTIAETVRALDEKAATLEAFVAQWANPYLAFLLAEDLTWGQAKTLADVLAMSGEHEIATQWLAYQDLGATR